MVGQLHARLGTYLLYGVALPCALLAWAAIIVMAANPSSHAKTRDFDTFAEIILAGLQ